MNIFSTTVHFFILPIFLFALLTNEITNPPRIHLEPHSPRVHLLSPHSDKEGVGGTAFGLSDLPPPRSLSVSLSLTHTLSFCLSSPICSLLCALLLARIREGPLPSLD